MRQTKPLKTHTVTAEIVIRRTYQFDVYDEADDVLEDAIECAVIEHMKFAYRCNEDDEITMTIVNASDGTTVIANRQINLDE